MPIVASMGGNAGTQTMTVAVRALALKQLAAPAVMRFALRETAIGLLNGAAFALIMGAIAWWWFGSPALGAVIGSAMIINLLAGLNYTLKSVNIYALQQSTFFAYLLVEQRDSSGQLAGVIRVDSRPSDGIALAVRAKCPIYVAESVMEEAGQDVSAIRFGDRSEEGEDGSEEDDLEENDSEEDDRS